MPPRLNMSTLEHKGHKTYYPDKKDKRFFITTIKNCPACSEEDRIKKEADDKKEICQFENAEKLYCDRCKKFIGYVYEFDLEGNKFYCKECKETTK